MCDLTAMYRNQNPTNGCEEIKFASRQNILNLRNKEIYLREANRFLQPDILNYRSERGKE